MQQLAKTAAWGPIVRRLQLGIVRPAGSYTAGKSMDLIVLLKNTGQDMDIIPPWQYLFDTTVVDSQGKEAPLLDRDLNISGAPSVGMPKGKILGTTLSLYQRYHLSPGTYRVTVSINIIQGSSFPGNQPRSVYARPLSPTITITVLPGP